MRPLLPLLLLLAALPSTATEELEPPPVLETGAVAVYVGSSEIEIPVSMTAQGPLFALAPLVARLGGDLRQGLKRQGYILTLGQSELLFGPDSDKVVIGKEIVPLSQPPQVGAGGLQVPLDLLERSFGDEMGFGFEWDPLVRWLKINRVRARSLSVDVTAARFGGTTTLVLRFPDPPRYRIVERPGGVDVVMVGDQIASSTSSRLPRDSLIEDVSVQPGGVSIDLAPRARAVSRVVPEPFQLVFDIYRERIANAAPSLVRPPRRSGINRIIIDPGHGGSESGAVGSQGTVEKDLTLKLAKALRRGLLARLPVEVTLTRDEDANLPLDLRTAIANEKKGDLFVSLHLNSSKGSGAQGAETFFLDAEPSDSDAAASAEAENAASMGDPLSDLELMLWDLAQTRYLAESQRLAKLIQEEFNSALGLRDRGVKQAPFRVLMGAAMPAVLIELGFLSNAEEERRLQDPEHQDQLVEAMVQAISRYRAQVEPQAPAEEEVVR